jgi:hypothetical protein
MIPTTIETGWFPSRDARACDASGGEWCCIGRLRSTQPYRANCLAAISRAYSIAEPMVISE